MEKIPYGRYTKEFREEAARLVPALFFGGVMQNTVAIKFVTGLVCVVVSIIVFSGRADRYVDFLGPGKLARSNASYLTASFNKATAGFGVMSLIKAGLAIVEGSEIGASIGVTARVEVGDFVQPVYDYVDIAWRTFLYGSVVLLGTKFVLEAVGLIDSYVLGFALMVAAVAFFIAGLFPHWQKIRVILRDLLAVSVVSALALYLLLPLSIWGASHLSRIITAPEIAEAEQGFLRTQQHLFPEQTHLQSGWIERFKATSQRLEMVAAHFRKQTRDFVLWTIKLIAGYVFDCIVFPVSLFYLLLWLTRGMMRYVFQSNFQRSLSDEFRRIVVLARNKEHEATDSAPSCS